MYRLTTLGALDLRDHRGHAVRDVLAQPKRLALLVYLAVEARRAPLARGRVLAMFWPESDETRARNALSQALYHLRQALPAGALLSESADTIAVQPGVLWCDAIAFEEAIECGDADLALDLYRGGFCDTLPVEGMPDLEHWLDGRRASLRRAALAAARGRAEALAVLGDMGGAARVARHALALHPDDEHEARELLALLGRAGDRAGALAAYESRVHHLRAMLDAAPEPETVRLVAAIRAQAPATELPVAAPRLSPPPAVRGAPPRRRSRRLAIAAMTVVMAGAALAALLRRGQAPPALPQAQAIAVFPFAAHGGANAEYLAAGMPDLMSATLDGALGYTGIDPRSITAATDGATPDSAAQARIAARLGARWYVTGDVVQGGGHTRITATLRATDGSAPPSSATATAATADVFALVDALSGRILAAASGGRDTTLTQLAAVTTSSLPALKAFLRGEQALRRGRDTQAAAAFEEAVALDSTFALAQYRLAITATWVSPPAAEDPLALANSAARHAERLSPLGKDLLAAYRAYRNGDGEGAHRLYDAVTRAHPDNVEAWLMLGETEYHMEPPLGRSPLPSRAAFTRALALDPGNAHALLHLARIAAQDGDVDAFDSLARRYRRENADAERQLEMAMLAALVHHDTRARDSIINAHGAIDVVTMSSLVTDAAVDAEDLDAAALIGARFAPAGDDYMARTARRITNDLDLAAGRWNAAPRFAVDPTFSLESRAMLASERSLPVPASVVSVLRDSIAARRPFSAVRVTQPYLDESMGAVVQAYLVGLLSLRLGDTASVQRSEAAIVAAAAAHPGPLASGLLHALRAERARAAGRPEVALAELDSFPWSYATAWTRPLHWGIRERYARAELLHAVGREREALAAYESFFSPWDLPFIAPAHLRRAEIHAALGERERAAFHYGRFIDLWSNADPPYAPSVARARAARAALAGRS